MQISLRRDGKNVLKNISATMEASTLLTLLRSSELKATEMEVFEAVIRLLFKNQINNWEFERMSRSRNFSNQ